MKNSQLLKKIKLSNTIGIIVNGVLISTIILPERTSILTSTKVEISKSTIEIILTKSERKDEIEKHKNEVYVIDLNKISQNIDYGQDAIGGHLI